MKKTYQNPLTTVITIETAKMIANSGGLGFSDTLGTTNVDGGSALSRHNSIWDDDEDYDDLLGF